MTRPTPHSRTLQLLLLAGALLSTVPVAADAPTGPAPSSGISGERIEAVVRQAHQKYAGLKEGKNADYIPALKKVDPNLFGITVVTVDGKVYESGSASHPFSIQSISKVYSLAKLMEEVGPEAIEKKIGVNATGQPFNAVMAIEMDKKHQPGNPLVNAGAIATVSMIPAKSADDKWSKIIGAYNAFAGRDLNVDQEVYKSETDTNGHNRAIAELLKSYDTLQGDPSEALDLYTRQCSVSVTAHDLAVMGATLANGGINPITGKRVLEEKYVPKVLAVMTTAGLYETSGDWSYKVGLPGKSGVGGGIVAIVPGKFAIGTFSPPLDEAGNSVRGQRAVEFIVNELGVNLYQGPSRSPRQARTPAKP